MYYHVSSSRHYHRRRRSWVGMAITLQEFCIKDVLIVERDPSAIHLNIGLYQQRPSHHHLQLMVLACQI